MKKYILVLVFLFLGCSNVKSQDLDSATLRQKKDNYKQAIEEVRADESPWLIRQKDEVTWLIDPATEKILRIEEQTSYQMLYRILEDFEKFKNYSRTIEEIERAFKFDGYKKVIWE